MLKNNRLIKICVDNANEDLSKVTTQMINISGTSDILKLKPILRIDYDKQIISKIYHTSDNYIIPFVSPGCIGLKKFYYLFFQTLKSMMPYLLDVFDNSCKLILKPDFPKVFNQIPLGYGFVKNEQEYIYRINRDLLLKIKHTKDHVKSLLNSSLIHGQGYCVSESVFDELFFDYIQPEYNDFLWGPTKIAKVDTLNSDEFSVINEFVFGSKALEIGCGAGRVTEYLLDKVSELYVSDYLPSIIKDIKDKSFKGNIHFFADDICKSQFASESFDLIMFWENGINNIFPESRRIEALNEISRLLTYGGKAILSTRALPASPIGHLMVTPQNENIMGVYNTYTPDSLSKILPKQLIVECIIDGSERPAGGINYYLILRKEAE